MEHDALVAEAKKATPQWADAWAEQLDTALNKAAEEVATTTMLELQQTLGIRLSAEAFNAGWAASRAVARERLRLGLAQ